MSIYRIVRPSAAVISLIALAGPASSGARAVDLADNLAGPTAGTESAAGERWLAAAFKTDAVATYRLTSVSLLLASSGPGSVTLELYSDGGLEPGARISTLIPPQTFASVPEPATFGADGGALAASTTYWVVLSATSGSFEWAWTTDGAGSGAGFDPSWDLSEDAGASWFTHVVYPLQLRVTASTTEPVEDCNENGVADDDDIRDGTSGDCDANGTPDECDIASGDARDINANGRPDGCEPAFLRSDSNCDGATDISDSVATLLFLFAGGAPPCCGDAADFNDDGIVDISDPIRGLNHLFQGGPPAAAPGASLPCGVDPTGDSLDALLPCDYPRDACL